ncbi:Bifunctional protein FolD protein [Pseudodesulfovibrio hydrargyri]|uniref:Bifunctional protein FolD n=1 Tax=Pseudodesulfovibrio hydrargyri TaxID=2125990 RepID=A0A1J5MTY5_9BACT|nr:bifunctional methylenetetrahydrofolate dehydrogenase/methenyltetrahydrofolate cyclohydrolase FolD [Pseudodesulfovibrio hydrargyri]OIQ50093.1 Bifunctional protein FolD protein [Pseudodesulfovibrio hydrargyri]
MILLDGKETAATIRAEIREEVDKLTAKYGRKPGLAVVLVGGDPASQVYVRNKERACEDCGIRSIPHRLETASQLELEGLIHELNNDVNVDGILVQLPLPEGLNSQKILDMIDPNKDVDGFHPVNVGKMSLGLPGFKPCTPAGVINLLKRYGLDPACKRAVVIGRSNIVGKPLAMMLSQSGPCANATVTLCHSRTADLKAECLEADYIFAAIGKPNFVTADMVKEGAVVVDVGINRTDEGLAGDCDFEGLKDKVHAITPVPGGVGPMTIAQLMVNTLEAFKLHVGA